MGGFKGNWWTSVGEPGVLNPEKAFRAPRKNLKNRLRECAVRLGSAPAQGPLAQLAEQVTLNHWVVGSSPTRPTNFGKEGKGLGEMRISD
jgi:hypothetical protein